MLSYLIIAALVCPSISLAVEQNMPTSSSLDQLARDKNPLAIATFLSDKCTDAKNQTIIQKIFRNFALTSPNYDNFLKKLSLFAKIPCVKNKIENEITILQVIHNDDKCYRNNSKKPMRLFYDIQDDGEDDYVAREQQHFLRSQKQSLGEIIKRNSNNIDELKNIQAVLTLKPANPKLKTLIDNAVAKQQYFLGVQEIKPPSLMTKITSLFNVNAVYSRVKNISMRVKSIIFGLWQH